jgi:hypothetical protein
MTNTKQIPHHPSSVAQGRGQSQHQRPLSTYTSLGSPIYRRAMVGSNGSGKGGGTISGRVRSMSCDASGSLFHPSLTSTSGAHPSTTFHGIGNPQASGMNASGGIWMLPNPLSSEAFSSRTDRSSMFGSRLGSQDLAEQQSTAVESALASEHARTKACEEEEVMFTADELRAVLQRERQRAAQLQANIAALRVVAGTDGLPQQRLTEGDVVQEEGRINGLMRRMDMLHEEKRRIAAELEREEDLVRRVFVLCGIFSCGSTL